MGDTQLHLRWHSHNMTFTGMLQDLHSERAYTDVSLICDGGIIRAHKAVLSLSSPYLAKVLSTCRESDEAPLLLPEILAQDIRYLISFIYRGQVDVPQQHIASFLNTGKHLHVHGLEQGDRLVTSPSKSDENCSVQSEVEDEIQRASTLGNNNVGEKKNLTSLGETAVSKAISPKLTFIKPENIKLEDNKIEKFIPEDGKIDLNIYLQQAIQSASMPCPLCNKEFKSQSGLRDHIRLHTGERPFVCEFCHMNFARASHLKRHRRMHTGEKPFDCSICGKDFSRGDKLKDHLRRHEADNKLTQIRQQILSLDEKTDEDAPSVTKPLDNNTTTFRSITSMSATQAIQKPPQDLPIPPAKRQCLNPKLPLLSLAQIPQEQLQNMIASSQSESVVPAMLGVTNIGECILRPIN